MSVLRNIGLLLFGLLFISGLEGQEEVIYLKNPSFEGIPRQGNTSYPGISAAGWIDCGAIMFPSETPPDIHPGNFFRVTKPAQDGDTYIGLVARENESWESVSQLLSDPLRENQCYSFSINLSRSIRYVNKEGEADDLDIKPQTESLVLRVYGGLRPCEKKQLLAESQLITHTDWRSYTFDFEAKSNLYYFTLEAFYKTPVLLPYNGNLLVDNLSPIKRIACPDEELIVEAEPEEPVISSPPVIEEEIVTADQTKVPEPPPLPVVKPRKEKTITEELNVENITAGQTIKINKLYFEADTSSINSSSYSALNEVYDFLVENPNIRIEIGGHTNGVPPHDYCDKLSEARAKAVAAYIIRKGIKPNRLEYKGYGKRKPIASNKSKEGRKRNQRVEITILNVN